MADFNRYKTEIVLIVVTFFFMLFITTNNNSALGTTYLLFLFGSAILLIFTSHVDVTVKKSNTTWLEEAMYGAGGWIVLLGASFLVLNYVDPLKANLGAIMSSLNAANPVFSNSVILNFMVIAFAIPLLETIVWGRGSEFFGDLFHVNISKQTKNTIRFIVLLIVFASLFAVFHATAKNLSGSALLVVFIMMAVSLYLIALRDGDMRAAIIMHVLANGVAAWLLLKGTIFTVAHASLPLLTHLPLVIKPLLTLGGLG